MARTGLRMMPTSPSSPLKFRTAGFPRYGFKAGLSGGAFPHGVHVSRRMVCVHPSCSPDANCESPFCAGGVCACEHRHASGISRSTPGALAPDWVLLSQSIVTYAAPSAPLTGASRLRRRAAYTRCPRCAIASATHEWFRAFAARSFSTCRPLRPRGPRRRLMPTTSPTTLAFAISGPARRSQLPHHPFQVGYQFRGFTGSLICYGLSSC
jgi:hypothetical protein